MNPIPPWTQGLVHPEWSGTWLFDALCHQSGENEVKAGTPGPFTVSIFGGAMDAEVIKYSLTYTEPVLIIRVIGCRGYPGSNLGLQWSSFLYNKFLFCLSWCYDSHCLLHRKFEEGKGLVEDHQKTVQKRGWCVHPFSRNEFMGKKTPEDTGYIKLGRYFWTTIH